MGEIFAFLGLAFLLVSAVIMVVFGMRFAPWLPSRRSAVHAALSAAAVGPDDVVIDLGAGTGTVMAEAARRGAAVRGVEIVPALWLFAWLRLLRYPDARVRIGNLYQTALDGATVVYTFNTLDSMKRVDAHLRATAPADAIILSRSYPIAGWTADEVIDVPGARPTYLYRGPGGSQR